MVASVGRVGNPTNVCRGVALAHVAAHAPQGMPVAGQLPLRLVVAEGEEQRDIREAGFQPLPGFGGVELVRPLGGLARRHFLLVRMMLEVVGHGEMGCALQLGRRHKRHFHRLAEEVVAKGKQPGPLAQMRLQGQE